MYMIPCRLSPREQYEDQLWETHYSDHVRHIDWDCRWCRQEQAEREFNDRPAGPRTRMKRTEDER